jgi:hypothetical protein
VNGWLERCSTWQFVLVAGGGTFAFLSLALGAEYLLLPDHFNVSFACIFVPTFTITLTTLHTRRRQRRRRERSTL